MGREQMSRKWASGATSSLQGMSLWRRTDKKVRKRPLNRFDGNRLQQEATGSGLKLSYHRVLRQLWISLVKRKCRPSRASNLAHSFPPNTLGTYSKRIIWDYDYAAPRKVDVLNTWDVRSGCTSVGRAKYVLVLHSTTNWKHLLTE